MRASKGIARREERGSALVMALVVVIIVATVGGAYLVVVNSQATLTVQSSKVEFAMQIADSGISAAIAELNAQKDLDGDTFVGSCAGSINGGSFAVTITPPYAGPGEYTVQSTGTYGDQKRGIQIVTGPVSSSQFNFGAFSDGPFLIDSNAQCDSYNSKAGTYASQAVNKIGSHVYANQNGDIGTNSTLSIDSNVVVFGDSPAYGGILKNAGTVTGSTEPLPAKKEFPPIVIPPELSALTAKSAVAATSVTVGPGDVRYSTLSTKSNSVLTIKGPTRLLVSTFNLDSNTKVVMDTTGGPVTFYGTGDFFLNSNLDINMTGRPQDFMVYLTGTKNIEVDSNVKMQAVIYAPNASLKLDSNGHIMGALMAKSITQGSNYAIHYDESLAELGGGKIEYTQKLWKETQAK